MLVNARALSFPDMQAFRTHEKLTTSALVYEVGRTFRALAVGTTKSGMIAIVLISLAHWNFL